ncbi:10180_t:CDS:2 [Ambispora gerdemannii]|uniref:10180_t:CDS:1 n=1 Tax=Ambispora gerdemannii TaxID=144530 RepID=A0A9N8ZMZ7_9GLOM|nr:10180_t:CDS:2 [Ambispora gerdemannii]
MEYALTNTFTSNNSFLSDTNLNDTIRSVTYSMLDANFDNEEEELNEIEHYISEKLTNREINVLAWWKAHQTQFPRLVRMARDYLAIPTSSVASERAFSAGGSMITNKRSSLMPKTIRAAVSPIMNAGTIKRKVG